MVRFLRTLRETFSSADSAEPVSNPYNPAAQAPRPTDEPLAPPKGKFALKSLASEVKTFFKNHFTAKPVTEDAPDLHPHNPSPNTHHPSFKMQNNPIYQSQNSHDASEWTKDNAWGPEESADGPDYDRASISAKTPVKYEEPDMSEEELNAELDALGHETQDEGVHTQTLEEFLETLKPTNQPIPLGPPSNTHQYDEHHHLNNPPWSEVNTQNHAAHDLDIHTHSNSMPLVPPKSPQATSSGYIYQPARYAWNAQHFSNSNHEANHIQAPRSPLAQQAAHQQMPWQASPTTTPSGYVYSPGRYPWNASTQQQTTQTVRSPHEPPYDDRDDRNDSIAQTNSSQSHGRENSIGWRYPIIEEEEEEEETEGNIDASKEENTPAPAETPAQTEAKRRAALTPELREIEDQANRNIQSIIANNTFLRSIIASSPQHRDNPDILAGLPIHIAPFKIDPTQPLEPQLGYPTKQRMGPQTSAAFPSTMMPTDQITDPVGPPPEEEVHSSPHDPRSYLPGGALYGQKKE